MNMANNLWDATADERLRNLIANKEPLEDIAVIMGRDEQAIETRADELGLITTWDKVCRARQGLEYLVHEAAEKKRLPSAIRSAIDSLCRALDVLRDEHPVGIFSTREQLARATAPPVFPELKVYPNIEGSGRAELVQQHKRVARACDALLEALGEQRPHQRDFLTAPKGTYDLARNAWNIRFAAIDALKNVTTDEAVALQRRS